MFTYAAILTRSPELRFLTPMFLTNWKKKKKKEEETQDTVTVFLKYEEYVNIF